MYNSLYLGKSVSCNSWMEEWNHWRNQILMCSVDDAPGSISFITCHTKTWSNDEFFYLLVPITMSKDEFLSLLNEAISNKEFHIGKTYPIIHNGTNPLDSSATFEKDGLVLNLRSNYYDYKCRNPHSFNEAVKIPYGDLPELLRTIKQAFEVHEKLSKVYQVATSDNCIIVPSLLDVTFGTYEVPHYVGVELIDSSYWEIAIKQRERTIYPSSGGNCTYETLLLNKKQLIAINEEKLRLIRDSNKKSFDLLNSPVFYLNEKNKIEVEQFRKLYRYCLNCCLNASKFCGRDDLTEHYSKLLKDL